jgi:hypothetical protein
MSSDAPPRRIKLNLCKICKDSAAIHASFPEVMRKFFRRTQVIESFSGND